MTSIETLIWKTRKVLLPEQDIIQSNIKTIAESMQLSKVHILELSLEEYIFQDCKSIIKCSESFSRAMLCLNLLKQMFLWFRNVSAAF